MFTIGFSGGFDVSYTSYRLHFALRSWELDMSGSLAFKSMRVLETHFNTLGSQKFFENKR
jgi:hypothetical protein